MDARKIGIIGAGRLGTALAKALSKAGYEVSISNSRGPESLALQLQILLPGVIARDTSNLVDWSDVIILAVPLPRFTQLPLKAASGKIVIDAMNYWAPVDGQLAEFDAYAGSSSELVAASMPGATLVKTFNSVAYSELEEQALPADDPKRRGIPLAGDNHKSNSIAAELINATGFDAVGLGDLAQGTKFQPDTALFNQRLTKTQILASV